ncbi:MAG: class I SAM-dependent methyltransferase [Rhizobiales bacterium]|nr:class I SAM-dependent methyltransferase [Hyphomicrobiales bacterium]
MIEGEPSRTARRVAVLRAVHQIRETPKVLDDPLAVKIIGPDAEKKIRDNPKRYETMLDRPLRAALVSRARFAEEALAAAIGRGIGQMVVLGAGLDTFAYRSPLAPKVRVFEVDFPATQAWKRKRLAEAGIAQPPNLTFAPIDFTRDTLEAGLERAGVDLGRPVFFSWLGVTYYLERDTVLATFERIGRMPEGSEVVFDYSESVRGQSLPIRLVFRFLSWRVARMGEPWKSNFSPADIRTELGKRGFGEIEDLDADAINQRWFAGRADGLKMRGLVHFVRARVGR